MSKKPSPEKLRLKNKPKRKAFDLQKDQEAEKSLLEILTRSKKIKYSLAPLLLFITMLGYYFYNKGQNLTGKSKSFPSEKTSPLPLDNSQMPEGWQRLLDNKEKSLIISGETAAEEEQTISDIFNTAIMMNSVDEEIQAKYPDYAISFEIVDSLPAALTEFQNAMPSFSFLQNIPFAEIGGMNAFTVSFGTDRKKLLHHTLIEKSVFKDLAQIVSVLNHELWHIFSREEENPSDDYIQTELKICEKSLASLKRIRQSLMEKEMDQPIMIKMITKLEEVIKEESDYCEGLKK